MIIEDRFNNNGNNYKNFNNQNETPGPKRLHSNQGYISTENNLLTKEISTYKYTEPSNTQAMEDKAVAMLHQRYKNKLINSDDFNKKCTNIAKNRQ